MTPGHGTKTLDSRMVTGSKGILGDLAVQPGHQVRGLAGVPARGVPLGLQSTALATITMQASGPPACLLLLAGYCKNERRVNYPAIYFT